ncbi:hypothetical protein GOODEAATRI_008481, partial [Goodea atripinnis]
MSELCGKDARLLYTSVWNPFQRPAPAFFLLAPKPLEKITLASFSGHPAAPPLILCLEALPKLLLPRPYLPVHPSACGSAAACPGDIRLPIRTGCQTQLRGSTPFPLDLHPSPD